MRGAGGTPGGMGTFLIGIGTLFYNGRSVLGWVLTLAGALIIFVGIVANLSIYFQPSSLFDTLLILVLIVGGIGVVARSLRDVGPPAA